MGDRQNMISQLQLIQRLIAGATGVVLWTSVHAQEAGSTPAVPVTFGSADLLNVGGGLLIVVFAIILVGIFYARTQGLRGGSRGIITVVASQVIGPKEKIVVIEVANKQLLLGMTTSSVQTLHVFDKRVVTAPEPVASFADRLRSAMRIDRK